MNVRLNQLTKCPCLAVQYFINLVDEAWLHHTALFARSYTLYPTAAYPLHSKVQAMCRLGQLKRSSGCMAQRCQTPSMLDEKGRDSVHGPTSKRFDLSHLLALQGMTALGIAIRLCCICFTDSCMLSNL